jgi:replicative DNA helicase
MNAPDTDSSGAGGGRPPFREIAGGLEPDQPDRSPPHSAEAEEHVLAVCLLDGETGGTIARCQREKLVPDAFYFPANRLIYDILLDLNKRGKPCTLEVLAEELKTRRQLEAVGGFAYLVQITGKIPTTAHAGYFIEKVREKFVLRKLIMGATDLVEKAYAFTGGLDEFVSKHTLRLLKWADYVTRLNRPGQVEDAEAARKKVLEIQAGKVDKTRQLVRGLPYADEVFGPYDVGNEDWFIVVAGGPSAGKSSRMREIAGYNCCDAVNPKGEVVKAGKRGAVFLLETGSQRWRWALASTLSHVNLRMMLEEPKLLAPADLKKWNDWNDEITRWAGERLFVYDDVYYFEDIERTVRELDRSLREKEATRLAAEGKDPATAHGLDFVVIDYLQLMTPREKIRMREEQVAYMSKGCKRLFKSLNLTGFVGSQLNRKARDEERRPRLSDLRESGAIEQDADGVEILYLPATDRSGQEQTGDRAIVEMELIAAKRRNGPANVAVDVLFHRTQTRFSDAPRKGDPRPGAPMPRDGYKREPGK